MAECPKCHTQLKEDFGLETCSGCGLVVFVNDDIVTVQDEDEGDLLSGHLEAAPLDGLEENIEDFEQPKNLENDLPFEPVLTSEQDSLGLENGLEDTFSNPLGSETQFESESGDSLSGSEFETSFNTIQEAVAGDHANSATEALIAKPDPNEEILDDPMSADDFLNEMQKFGELDSDKFQDGIYFFDIEISGIDSAEIKEEVVDALEDSKFNLKMDPLRQKIKNGILNLKAIPAVKAYMIVQKLTYLPCEVSWNLLEIHELENEKISDAETSSPPANVEVSEAKNDLDDFNFESSDEFS